MRLSTKNRLHAALNATPARLDVLGSHIRQAGPMEPAKVAVAHPHVQINFGVFWPECLASPVTKKGPIRLKSKKK